jgi:hypothetical protein
MLSFGYVDRRGIPAAESGRPGIGKVKLYRLAEGLIIELGTDLIALNLSRDALEGGTLVFLAELEGQQVVIARGSK